MVDRLLKIWEYEAKRGTVKEVDGFIWMNREIHVPIHRSIFVVKDLLKISAYKGGESANKKDAVELKATWRWMTTLHHRCSTNH
jgi:hypothetical protein